MLFGKANNNKPFSSDQELLHFGCQLSNAREHKNNSKSQKIIEPVK